MLDLKHYINKLLFRLAVVVFVAVVAAVWFYYGIEDDIRAARAVVYSTVADWDDPYFIISR